MRIALYIVAVVILGYLGMLATTIVRDSCPIDLSGEVGDRALPEYELSEHRWEHARLRHWGGRLDKLELKRGYGEWQPEPLDFMSPESRFIEASRSVGRVQVKLKQADDQIVVKVCSGVLVSKSHVLTAWHCLRRDTQDNSTEAEPVAAAVRFGLVNDNFDHAKAAGHLFDLEPKPLDRRRDLDYALFRLKETEVAKVAEAGYPPARLSSAPVSESNDAFIIGHPLAGPLRLSRANCRVTKIATDPSTQKFRHSCGTARGVSGAPIFDDHTCSVVALHVAARPNDIVGPTVGYGVPVGQIMAASREIRSVVSDATSGCPPARPNERR